MLFSTVLGFVGVLVSLATASSIPTPVERARGDVFPRAPSTFTHPGVLIDRAQLYFIKGKVNSGAEVQSFIQSHTTYELTFGARSPGHQHTIQCSPRLSEVFPAIRALRQLLNVVLRRRRMSDVLRSVRTHSLPTPCL